MRLGVLVCSGTGGEICLPDHIYGEVMSVLTLNILARTRLLLSFKCDGVMSSMTLEKPQTPRRAGMSKKRPVVSLNRQLCWGARCNVIGV
jgi:hypothetical protein